MDRRTLELNGGLFESMIAQLVKQTQPNGYNFLNKELYSYKLQTTTQLDVIFVTSKFIYVIEAKNWVDWVKGSYDDITWTGKSRSKNIMQVMSPFRQNLMHIRTLRCSALRQGIILPPIVNIICFPDSTKITSDCAEVCKYSQLPSIIREFEGRHVPEYDVMRIVKIIKGLE